MNVPIKWSGKTCIATEAQIDYVGKWKAMVHMNKKYNYVNFYVTNKCQHGIFACNVIVNFDVFLCLLG